MLLIFFLKNWICFQEMYNKITPQNYFSDNNSILHLFYSFHVEPRKEIEPMFGFHAQHVRRFFPHALLIPRRGRNVFFSFIVISRGLGKFIERAGHARHASRTAARALILVRSCDHSRAPIARIKIEGPASDQRNIFCGDLRPETSASVKLVSFSFRWRWGKSLSIFCGTMNELDEIQMAASQT